MARRIIPGQSEWAPHKISPQCPLHKWIFDQRARDPWKSRITIKEEKEMHTENHFHRKKLTTATVASVLGHRRQISTRMIAWLKVLTSEILLILRENKELSKFFHWYFRKKWLRVTENINKVFLNFADVYRRCILTFTICIILVVLIVEVLSRALLSTNFTKASDLSTIIIVLFRDLERQYKTTKTKEDITLVNISIPGWSSLDESIFSPKFISNLQV